MALADWSEKTLEADERPRRRVRRRHRTSPDLRADLAQLRRLFRYVRPYRGRLVAGLVTGALFGAISGGFPRAVQLVFHRLFESGQPPRFWSVVATAAAIPLYFVLRGLMGFLSTYCLSWVSSRMLRDIRVELFSHLQGLSMDFFVRQRVSRLIQRVNNNTQTMQASLVDVAGDIVRQPITILASIVVLAYINVWFCLFALVLGALCLVPMGYLGRKVRRASLAEDESAGQLLGLLHESFSNVRVIKAYLLERLQDKRFRQAANRQMSRSLYFKRQRELVPPLIELIGSFGIAAALVYVYFARIEQSEFMAVVAGFFMMYEPLKRLGQIHVHSQRVLNVADRVFDLLDTTPAAVDRPDAVRLERFTSEIRFEGVHLRYHAEEEALAGVDLTIPCGSVCALVGPSGSGKTSLINLLLRFYEPTRGCVRIDGRDLTEVSTASLRGLIGLVTQDTILFADTVANNIAYGRPGATADEIVEAAKKAHAHDFITALREGYDTVLSDRGQNLSGGQAQRIAIARAFLKNPAILVLDEATSALDAHSEQQVQEATSELMRGRTVIIIAHRLSALRHADQFVVLDRGRIVEAGGHDELMRRDGLYRRLYDLQVV
jgi:subfamily B ATP-binding cassette protein MsbA